MTPKFVYFRFIKVERQFEQALKEKKGFIIKKMAQDGACLFRAVGTYKASLIIIKALFTLIT